MHISFSSLKDWNDCPWKFKIYKIDGLRSFLGNEHTTFGNAMHAVAENKVNEVTLEHWEQFFDEEFVKAIGECKDRGVKVGEFDKSLISQMRNQGRELIPLIMPALKNYFGDFTLLGAEIELNEPIEGFEKVTFKGFIDLVVATPDGKVHIIDWKTCSWGWDKFRKSDKMTSYQLTLYKKFFCQKADLEPNLVETHFGLLKRIGKNPDKRVEIFRVTSGSKKTKNALDLLNRAAISCEKNFFPKNRLSCSNCAWKKTKHCP